MDPQSRRRFLASFGQFLAVGTVGTAFTPKWSILAESVLDGTVRRTFSMGTVVNLTLPHGPPTDVFTEAFNILYRVDENLSAHQEKSDLSQMNGSPDEWYPGSDDLLYVARAAINYGELTGGAFDVTVLPAMQRLGFVPGTLTAPSMKLAERIDYTQLHVRNNHVRVGIGFGVDLGGIAKGYGVDEAIVMLKKRGVKSALLEAGGDIFAHGRPSADRKWCVGVRNPRRLDKVVATIELEDEAIATSGTYLQTREHDGRNVGHLIDARSGESVMGVLSCTVVARSTMEADVLATAASVLPRSEGQALINSVAGAEMVSIYDDRTSYVSDGLRHRVKWS